MQYDEDKLSCFLGTSSSCCLKSNCGLEWIVDPPLKTGQGTDHDDSCDQSCPQSFESDLLIDSSYFLTYSAFFTSFWVDLGDHGVSGVGDYGAEDTSKITGCEGDAELCGFTVIFFAFGEDVIIEELHEPFESDEFHNGVRNLSGP